ncbi:endolytic transglycosylase MltG [Lederbergia citrea]|uniref:Endolytic murein transglycosylase n=1 Tax=Lederbergia citrea TaxID=2833581 RepID=A0A942Z2H2_9BACI|nr:endolytic transglycosylase MltG [Lederbergia citrea]MBS4176249.1 endolytic transglycosylase MltG [Lederbergia citrea]MBS4202809.1 endolytic transglycosylase MltG [Lederbergia citrea]MBS4222523.1 endolytic transglycosylase MltG [Lederbergia citrea]
MRNNLIERRNEAKIIRRIVAIIALILILAVGGAALGGYFYIQSALKPVDSDNNKLTDVEVPIGSSTTSIGKLLEKKGIIKNATIFKYYVKFNNISGFQAGNYSLTPSMTLDEITDTLQTGKMAREAVFKLTIPEGLQLDQISTIIAKNIDMSSKEILEKLNDPDTIAKLMKKYPDLLTKDILDKNIKRPLEGYLYPATYSFYEKNPSLDAILDVMLSQTRKVVAKYTDAMTEKEMDIHQLLTFASLIEKEATKKADRNQISSVFYNRIEQNMPLQTDPTVLYALGEHKTRTLYKDLEVDSPYNTYKIQGLPPGPIANAGESSIEAALNPADSDYLYFLAEHGTGKVHYAKTLEEHNELKQKYITNKRK